MKPFVTCMCPTYGRVNLLEESIESFLRQDYEGPKELLILNDLPEQVLVCDIPQVRVINLKQRCENLGAKRNLAARHSDGELLITWSDDDIHLPNRISSNVKAWDRGRYVAENHYLFLCKHERSYKKARLMGPFLMSKEEFFDLGGIPDAFTAEDEAFCHKVNKSMKVVFSEEPTYIYRWGVTERFHASWFTKKADAWEQIQSRVDGTLKDGREPVGVVQLKPHWKEDYEKLREELLCARN